MSQLTKMRRKVQNRSYCLIRVDSVDRPWFVINSTFLSCLTRKIPLQQFPSIPRQVNTSVISLDALDENLITISGLCNILSSVIDIYQLTTMRPWFVIFRMVAGSISGKPEQVQQVIKTVSVPNIGPNFYRNAKNKILHPIARVNFEGKFG